MYMYLFKFFCTSSDLFDHLNLVFYIDIEMIKKNERILFQEPGSFLFGIMNLIN